MSDLDNYIEGIRVLELGEGIAAAYCGLVLADAGAEVLKVELPSGDRQRESPGGGVLFASLNRGKQSAAVDWHSIEGAEVLSRLLQQADVVIHEVESAQRERLEALLAPHADRIVVSSITPYGEKGPMADAPASELVVQAMSNYTAPLGVFGQEPVRVGADVAEMNTALYAAIGIFAALWERAESGNGHTVSTSLLGTLLHMRSISWAAQTNPDEWNGFHLEGQYWPPATAYKTEDGQAYFTLHRGSSEDWDRLLIGLDMLDVMDDPRFGDYGRGATGTGASDPAVKERFEQAFANKTTDELLALLRSVGSNAIAFNDYPHLFEDDHVKALGLGTLRTSNGVPALASPWMGDVEPKQEDMQAHLEVAALGQHTLDALVSAGMSPEECQALAARGTIVLA